MSNVFSSSGRIVSSAAAAALSSTGFFFQSEGGFKKNWILEIPTVCLTPHFKTNNTHAYFLSDCSFSPPYTKNTASGISGNEI